MKASAQVKRRVCESCFFYEVAGIVNSGWCRHPDRQFDSGVRLVVRGSELNCRNGWNEDLWVPAGIEPGSPDATNDLWPYADQQDDQLTSIVPARYEGQQSPPADRNEIDDVVVRHTPYPGYTPPQKEARDLITHPKAAILKAREQFKDRQLREGRIADRIERPPLVDATDDLLDSGMNGYAKDHYRDQLDPPRENAPFLGEGAKSAPRRPEYAVPPVSRDEIPRPYVTITHFPEDEQRFESVPDRFTNIPTQPLERLVQDFTVDSDELLQIQEDEFEEWYDDELIAENGQPVESSRRRRESIVDRLFRERREKRLRDIDDAPMSLERSAPHPDDLYNEYAGDFEVTGPSLPDEQHPESASTAVAGYRGDPSWDPPTVRQHRNPELEFEEYEWPVGTMVAPWSANGEYPEEDYVTNPHLATKDDLPPWEAAGRQPRDYQHSAPATPQERPLSSDWPQICRTCRDFRPADSGDRGWCNNLWAFRHRRMTDAGVLSCESSFGNWWIPHDGIWQKAADVSRHAQETPLLDRLLGIEDLAVHARAGSVSGRER